MELDAPREQETVFAVPTAVVLNDADVDRKCLIAVVVDFVENPRPRRSPLQKLLPRFAPKPTMIERQPLHCFRITNLARVFTDLARVVYGFWTGPHKTLNLSSSFDRTLSEYAVPTRPKLQLAQSPPPLPTQPPHQLM